MKRIKMYLFGIMAAVLGLTTVLGYGRAQAQTTQVPPAIQVKVESFSLPNGMLFLVVNRPDLPQVACRLGVRAGSTFESRGNTGIAHMLEHMLFKGTKNYGTTDLKQDLELQRRIEAAYQQILSEENKANPDQRKIDKAKNEMTQLREKARAIYLPNVVFTQLGKNGATSVNAGTSYDFTMYQADMPSDMLEQWFSLISEQVFEPEWREFYVEKDVVLQEWGMRTANNPDEMARQNLMNAAYQAMPYNHPIIGWKADIERFSTMAAIDYHSAYYAPNNTVVVLVGNVDVKEAKRLAKIYFERYPKGADVVNYVTTELEQTGPREIVAFMPGARKPLVYLGFHGSKIGTKDFYALDALTYLLSSGRSSRLQQNLVNSGLMTSAIAYNPDQRFASLFIMKGVPALPNANGDETAPDYLTLCQNAKELMLGEVDKVIANGLSDKELARIKMLARRDFIDTLRDNGNLAEVLSVYEIYIGHDYLNTYLQELEKVTAKDIRDVAAKYLTRDNLTVSIMLPGDEKGAPPQAYSETRAYVPGSQDDDITPKNFANHSVYPTPDGWRHPLSFQRHPELINYKDASQFEVNSARVFYLKDASLPLAEIKFLIKAGSVDIPDDKQGLSDLIGQVLLKGGAGSRSPQALAEFIDDNAMYVRIITGEEHTEITLSVLSETFEKALQMLGDIIVKPGLDENVFNAAVQQQLMQIHIGTGDAGWLASMNSSVEFFKGSPYGDNPLDELETLPMLEPGDIKNFMTKYFVPSNMTIAFAGNLDEDYVRKQLERFTARLGQQPAPERQAVKPEMRGGTLYFINKPGQVQSQVFLMLPSVRRDDPNFWKLNFLSSLYGGSDSLLWNRLRNDLGLVYSTFFTETYKWEAGYFVGYIGCQGGGTGLAIRETAGLMESLKQGVKKQDVERKKQELLNGFVFNTDTNFALVSNYAQYALRNEPLDTLERIQAAFSEVTAEELTELAKTYFDIAKLQIVVVGDKDIVAEKSGEGKMVLHDDLRVVAKELGLTFVELPLP